MKKTNRFLWFTRQAGLSPVQNDDVSNMLPEWIESILEDDDDRFDQSMAEAGAVMVEEYGIGIGEQLHVWELPPEEDNSDSEEWLVRYWADDSRFCVNIIITTLSDYMMFQTMWLSLTAQKIIHADQYYRWQEELRIEHMKGLH